MPEENDPSYQLTAKDVQDLFKYLENISVKLNRINTHLLFYSIILVLALIFTILF